MRRMMLFVFVMLMILLPSCGKAPKDPGHGLEVPGGTPAANAVIRGEFPEAMPEEPEPEPETAYKDSVASITPDFRPDILDKESQNPDTVGWLYIPGTTVDQVVLQNPPALQDNQFYLDVDFNRAPDKNGTFCTDFRNKFGSGSRSELSRITTVFGHSWSDDPNGELFEQLKKFRDPEFARTHPYIFFSTRAENMAFEVFAVFDTTVHLPYITPDLDDDEMYDLLDTVDKLSEYSYYSAVSPDDKLLVLSTCTYSVRGRGPLPENNDYRFAIMAKLADPKSPKLEEAVFHVNENPATPDMVPMLMSAWKNYTFPAYIIK